MSISSEILAAVKDGVPEPLVIAKYSWPGLPVGEREALLSQIDSGAPGAPDLLRLVARMALNSPGCTPWEEARILSLGVRRMGWPSQRKALALEKLRQVLEALKSSLKPDDKEQNAQLERYQGGYWELHAGLCLDDDRLKDAIDSYRQACACYHRCGERKTEQQIRQQLRLWEEIRQKGDHLVSNSEIEGERARLQHEIAALSDQNRQKTKEREQLTQELRLQADRRDELQQQIERLETEIDHNTAVLQFFLAVNRQSTAPLWIEVLKAVLAQGEIDEYSLQALHRLMPHLPEQAGALTGEIVARLPGPPPQGAGPAASALSEWIESLRLAEQALSSDPAGAAEWIVRAWQVFETPPDQK